jgi:hypothetical protein
MNLGRGFLVTVSPRALHRIILLKYVYLLP